MPGNLIRRGKQPVLFGEDIDVPLPGKQKLRLLSAALMDGDHMVQRFLLQEKSSFSQYIQDSFSCFSNLHSADEGCVFADPPIGT